MHPSTEATKIISNRKRAAFAEKRLRLLGGP
jgi:hypothetical protein